ncbi:MAG: glycoside hydrolase family 32 protein, partial [Roseicyclus sp.]
VWGHQVSSDLGTWERRRPALMPTTGFDQRGIWVGNWIPGREPPAVLYTGVDGHSAGIGLAEARPDGSLDLVRVVAEDTPTEYQDMRDPWVVRTDDGWLMLIGAGARDRDEAIVYSYTSDDGTEWEPAGEFDTGGVEMPGQYWELPVLIEIGGRWMLMGTPVVANSPARTLYWLGEFDGERFIPDEPEPRQIDILATFRAPTLAEGPDGEIVAVGIVADEIRGERERHESGWVHVLTPAIVLQLCEDTPFDLCQNLAPAFVDTFEPVRTDSISDNRIHAETGGRPVILRADIDATEGGVTKLDVRSTGDGASSAILTIDAGTGVVRLDYRQGPVQPLGRPAVIEGRIPPFTSLDVEILIDGAAVFGTLNGRPIAFLAFATTPGRDGLRLASEGGSKIETFEILSRDDGPR